jgi:hypothetical protein
MHEQTVKEVAGAIFYSLLSLYDDQAMHESTKLLKAAADTGCVRDPAAKDILRSIARSAVFSVPND